MTDWSKKWDDEEKKLDNYDRNFYNNSKPEAKIKMFLNKLEDLIRNNNEMFDYCIRTMDDYRARYYKGKLDSLQLMYFIITGKNFKC